jgi:hypothetical protein
MLFTPRVIIRLLITVLALLVGALIAISFLPGPMLTRLVLLWITRPPDPTPPPPTITAPRGELPVGNLAFEEWAKYGLNNYRPVGSGFLLRVAGGEVIGVTTAHSVGDIGDPANLLEQVAFQIPGRDGYVAEFDVLYADPGWPRTGSDLTVDYLLLKPSGTVDPGLALEPDPRGAPQPGERVSMISGLGDGTGGRRLIGGTVQGIDTAAVWVLMDDMEFPGGMSGSPLVSEYTGRAIGMAIAEMPRGSRYLIGVHPIASILAKAAAARLIKIGDYTR